MLSSAVGLDKATKRLRFQLSFRKILKWISGTAELLCLSLLDNCSM